MTGIPRIQVTGSANVRELDGVAGFGAHFVDLGLGLCVANDAHEIAVGRRGSGDDYIVALMLARKAALMPHGMALVIALPVDEARAIARSLLAMADQVETAASAHAAAILARAAGKDAA